MAKPLHVQVLKGEANEEERKLATQLRGPLMPVQQPAPKSIARAITDEEKDFKAYQYLRGVSVFYSINLKSQCSTWLAENCTIHSKRDVSAGTFIEPPQYEEGINIIIYSCTHLLAKLWLL